MSRIVSKTIDLAGQGATEVSKYITNIGDDGIKVHPYNNTTGTIDQNNYTKIDSNGMEIWQEDNDTSIKVAEFGVDGTTIGKSDGSQSYLYEDYHSLKLIDKEGNPYFWVSDLRDSSGYAEIVETFSVEKTVNNVQVSFPINSPENYTPIITNGVENLEYTYVEGESTFHITTSRLYTMSLTFTYKTRSNLAKAYTFGVRDSFSSDKIGGYSFVEGYNCNAEGTYSHAEGRNTTADKLSHAEGEDSRATGYCSHAEGHARATGDVSHAEGGQAGKPYGSTFIVTSTRASGQCSHAEGAGTLASGTYAHAEGLFSEATGRISHAQNVYTLADSDYQTALGKYNIKDSNDKYAVIIGNGTSDSARSNALTVNWNGNVNIAVNTTATSGEDFDLYTVISNLGWSSDIIE